MLINGEEIEETAEISLRNFGSFLRRFTNENPLSG
jgi:hypothetical protein